MKQELDGIMEKFILMTLSIDYCQDNETIEDVIGNVNRLLKGSKDGKDFDEKLSNIIGRLSIIVKLLLIKKLKNNKKDILVIAQAVMKEIEEVTKLVEEEE